MIMGGVGGACPRARQSIPNRLGRQAMSDDEKQLAKQNGIAFRELCRLIIIIELVTIHLAMAYSI